MDVQMLLKPLILHTHKLDVRLLLTPLTTRMKMGVRLLLKLWM